MLSQNRNPENPVHQNIQKESHRKSRNSCQKLRTVYNKKFVSFIWKHQTYIRVTISTKYYIWLRPIFIFKGKKIWVDDGCTTSGTLVQGSFKLQSYKAAVRCCSNNGASCTTPLHCQHNKMTYADAVKKCSKDGRRLCTKDELNSGMCCGRGGMCDFYEVWTSTVSEKSKWQ